MLCWATRQRYETGRPRRHKISVTGSKLLRWMEFSGFKTANSEELPDAVAEMDSVHVVGLAATHADAWARRFA